MKVVLYGRSLKKEYASSINHLIKLLEKNKISIFIYKKFLELLHRFPEIDAYQNLTPFENNNDFPSDSNFLISLGGDGTLLETISFIRKSNIPIIGINLGRMGFLANIAENEIEEAVQAIIHNRYAIEDRALLKLQTEPVLFDEFPYALNEVTIQKKDSSLITIHTYINNSYANSYWADGLIISTPTGSTAYSLSVGGPIVSPDSKNIIISPIAPHNLTVRPIVIPDNCKLSFTLESRSNQFITTIDSKSTSCAINTKLNIELAEFSIKFLKLDKHDFYNTIRNKLMWGVDKRN